jgi:hypothetical protein
MLSLGSASSEQGRTVGGERNRMHWQAQTANLKQKVLTSPIDPPVTLSPPIKPSRPVRLKEDSEMFTAVCIT